MCNFSLFPPNLNRFHIEDVIQSCKDLIGSHCFAIEGLPAIMALHESDHEGHLVLRCGAIVAHTAMAVLLRTLSQALAAGQGSSSVPAEDQAPPLVYRRRCRKSLREAIKITRGFADADFPFIDVVMSVCWFQMYTMTTELDDEDAAMGISLERRSPPPSIPPASKSPTISNARPVSKADQIRQQQAQYHRERQQQQSSPLPSSPPHQATISEVHEDQEDRDQIEELSDLQMLDGSTKRLQASFWRPIPDALTGRMHGILERLRVVVENQEGVYQI